jgi:hypothetical protein
MTMEATTQRNGRAVLVVLAAAVIVTLLGWPFSRVVETGLDPSWMHALHLAAEQGLRFGSEIVYTYGPLGFLSVPTPPVGITSSFALIASGVVYLALAATSIVELRRWLPWWAAVLVALALARTWSSLPPFEALQVLAFIVGVELVLRRLVIDDRVVMGGAGVLAAVAALGKLNVGVFVAAMAVVVVVAVARPWWRGLLGFVVAGALATAALWLLTGQTPMDIAGYARGAMEIVSGYSQAMGTDRDPPSRHWIFPVFLAIAAVVAVHAALASRGSSRGRQVALGVLVGVILFAEWKTAFVRGYPGYAFATLAYAVLPLLVGARRLVASATLGAIALAFLASAPPRTTTPGALLDLPGSVRSALGSARDSLLPWNVADSAERTSAKLREAYDLPPSVLAELDGRRTHIEPSEAAAARAYPEIVWSPLPVFQTYHAYTPALDDLDATVLRGDARPERIVREYAELADGSGPLTVDHRWYWFDAPATTLERLCRYRESVADARWQVLLPTGASCGEPVPLGTVTALPGEAVSVPAPPDDQSLVTVRISPPLEASVSDRLRSALFKAREWFVELDGRRFRLVPGTVGQGLVVAGPAGIAGNPPFDLGPPIRSIAVSADPDGQGSTEPLTYEFFAHPVLEPVANAP